VSAIDEKAPLPTLEERLDRQMAYACDLMRIIEDLCSDRDIKTPETAARHHYNMAVAYRLALRQQESRTS
jgi:hypothetical protein